LFIPKKKRYKNKYNAGLRKCITTIIMKEHTCRHASSTKYVLMCLLEANVNDEM
jgi:hypothetical protein